ncbi:MAG: hypothetical protein ACNS62_22635 [Candidatus Cyclobacteriaceae bacterium M3_2C_046]
MRITLLIVFISALLNDQNVWCQSYWGASTGFDNINVSEINSSAMVNGNDVEAHLQRFSRTPTLGGDYLWLKDGFMLQIDAAYNSTALADLGKKAFTYQTLSDSGSVDGFDQLIHFKGGLGYNFSKNHILSVLLNGEALYGEFVYFNDVYSAINNFSLNNFDLDQIENSITYGVSLKFSAGFKLQNLLAITLTPGYSWVWNNNEDTSSRGFDVIVGFFKAF